MSVLSARAAYAQAAVHLAGVLRNMGQDRRDGQDRREAEQRLDRARVRYEMAVLALAESQEPVYRPDDPNCRHVMMYQGLGLFECYRCGRLGDWRDGMIVWHRETFAQEAPTP